MYGDRASSQNIDLVRSIMPANVRFAKAELSKNSYRLNIQIYRIRLLFVMKRLISFALATLLFACTPMENNQIGTEPGGAKDNTVHVTGISIDHSSATIKEGETLTLVANITPANAENKSVTWSSSSEAVATVDNTGKVTGVKAGSATITATAEDGGMKATCAITVAQWVTGISLNKTSLTLNEGEAETLVPTVSPSNSADKTIKWTSSDTSIATVDENGKVTAVSKGNATIKAEANDGSGKYATCEVLVKKKLGPLPTGAVDLGLSVYWSTCNLGASRPEDYGDYYAWGEVEPYYSSQDPLTWKEGKSEGYYWPSYKWCNGSSSTLSKYNTDNSCGSVDNKTVLDPEDDAAHVILGDKWRMPTDAEWTELREKCSWTWTTQNGVNGRLVTGKNGNSIFLPAAGGRSHADLNRAGSCCYYWSSSLGTDDPDRAWLVYFDAGTVDRYYFSRCLGRSIRPVSE